MSLNSKRCSKEMHNRGAFSSSPLTQGLCLSKLPGLNSTLSKHPLRIGCKNRSNPWGRFKPMLQGRATPSWKGRARSRRCLHDRGSAKSRSLL